METIYIKKVRNGYTVELSPWNGEDEMYLYKTKEEMVAELPKLIDRAHEINEEEAAKKANKANKIEE